MRGSLWLVALLVGAVRADEPILHDYRGYQKGTYGNQPKQQYHSVNITSPLFNYNTWRRDLIAGNDSTHLFLGLRFRDGGPYIFRDDDLTLVYADLQADYETVMNTRVQNVRGKDYLSFWHGAKWGGRGSGFCVFCDDHYQVKHNLTVHGATVKTDMHECQVTSDGTVLLTAYEDKHFNLSSLGVNIDLLADSCFQEVDIETNALRFRWCASDHFHPSLTFQKFYARKRDHDAPPPMNPIQEGLDTYHINSVQKTYEGNYLVSLRALKLITYINGTTGKPIWNLGGKMNMFTDITPKNVLDANPGSDGALSFGWQHTTWFRDESMMQIFLFDNHNVSTITDCRDETCSRGRILQINTHDPANLTVELIRDYRSPQGLISQVMGSMQMLDSLSNSSNILIGWGSNSEFTEHTIDGTLVRDVQFAPLDPRHAFRGRLGIESYRVFKHTWHGYPTWPPSVTLSEDGKLWVSWNGATEVKHWAIHGSFDDSGLGSAQGSGYGMEYLHEALVGRKPLSVVRRSGFETEIDIARFWMPYAKLAALDSAGDVIGTSEMVEIELPPVGCSLDCLALQTILFP